ncbi:MAG: hypothetical protein HYY78_05415 [Betaproteobacteria bacterium]|nr:hypothetical protein [Betaproteobacteria bacterium]
MTVFPRHPILRVVATAWLLVAAVLLLVTLLRPEIGLNERAALSSLVPLYFLSFPFGHAGVMALTRLKVDLYVGYHFVPGIFSEALMLWAALTVLGYAQWFVALPWVARKSRQFTDFLLRRYLAR